MSLAPVDDLIGKYLGVQASLAIASTEDLPQNRRRIYERGLDFMAKACGVDYYRNYDVPVDSVVIDFEDVHTMIDRAEFDLEEDVTEEYLEAPRVLNVRVPILAIRACAIELPWAA